MSQDMMQALSGSSLLSLSIGTLPAGKPGMNLDANPFASQLALMTGTDAAVAGMIAPVAVAQAVGEGAFAAALADMGESAAVATLPGDPAAPVLPEVAKPRVAPETPVVAALPEEASTAQLIEAALTGAASIATPAQAPEAPRANPAATPLAADAADAAPIVQQTAAHPSLTVQPLPHASQVPHLRNLIRADAPMPIQAQILPEAEPVADADIPSAPKSQASSEPADKVPTGEALAAPVANAAIAPAMPHTPAARPEAPRRSVEPQATRESPERPMPRHAAPHLASAPQTVMAAPDQPGMASVGQGTAVLASQPPAPPVSAAPLGGHAVAISIDARDTPVLPIAAEQDQAAPAASVAARLKPEAPHVRKAREGRDAVDMVQSPSSEAALAPPVIAAVPVTVPVTEAAPIAASATPARSVAAPVQPSAPRMIADQPAQSGIAASASTAPRPIEAQPAGEARQAAMPPASAPAQPAMPSAPLEAANAQPVAAPGQSAAAPSASTVGASVPSAEPQVASTVVTAQPVPTGAASAERRQQAPVQQASASQVMAPPAAAPAAAAPAAAGIAQAAQTVMATPVQSPVQTGRSQPSAAARRTVDTALQAPHAAEPRSSLFDRADLSVQPGTASLAIEPAAPTVIEAVPPAWAAALNAVNAQVQQASGATAPQAAAQPQVPMHHLAFDAGFVAGIESQIAKLVDGGQMMKIQVMPEHLGRIDIEMLAGPDRDQVRIVTEHDAVRETLASSQHRLEQDLRGNGQRNTEVTVELRQQSPGTQNGSAQQQQQRGQSGAESASARDAVQRQPSADQTSDTNPAPRRPRGNVRYA